MSQKAITFFGNGVQKVFKVPVPEIISIAWYDASGPTSNWLVTNANEIVFDEAPEEGVKMLFAIEYDESAQSGSGLTQEQYDGLVQDPELSNAVFAINDTTSYAVSNAISTINQKTEDSKAFLYQTVETVQTNLSQQIASLTVGSYPGKIDLVLRENGVATTGYTKLGGVVVPQNAWGYAHSVLVPYVAGTSGWTATQVLNATCQATVGESIYFLNQSKYTAGTLQLPLRQLAMGSLTWSNPLPVTMLASNCPPTIIGSVNGKLFASGFGTTTGTQNVRTDLMVFNDTSGVWTQRANKPTGTGGTAAADIGSGKAAFFGGALLSGSSYSPTPTSVSNVVEIFDDTTNTWTSKTALPLRIADAMCIVHPNKSVVIFPRTVSDGTTLTYNSRKVILWTEASGGSLLDDIPSDVGNIPHAVWARSDGKVVFVPKDVPATTARARLLDPSAATGSQWTEYDWSYNELVGLAGIAGYGEAKPTSSGYLFTRSGTFYLTQVGTIQPSWSQSFYQMKN